ncbi:hypothetical protein K440DRAFT_625576 [Wilcoxina mikolae CBS 423.85]|nr:hypothetical protein K440DRAFT_625576 [Wilcoxina mikolae CBS 423.85]
MQYCTKQPTNRHHKGKVKTTFPKPTRQLAMPASPSLKREIICSVNLMPRVFIVIYNRRVMFHPCRNCSNK